MTQNEFELLYCIRKHGLQSIRRIRADTGLSLGFISQTLRRMTERGFIDAAGITKAGLDALAPYKVDNAIIMAAGMSTRFVPLSLEKPKGLLEVKGEVLIERQIEQLRAAGIKDIVLVLGYKKEAFFYLEEKYDRLTIIINPEYHTKNNPHTLYLAQEHLGNSYICSSDDYFMENPFEEYVYRSYYASIHVDRKVNEWYMIPDRKGNISAVRKAGEDGYIMLGHVYWDRDFSAAMKELLNQDHETGDYSGIVWEQILADHCAALPPMEIKVYPDGTIFEFDSLEELRAFDDNYISHTHSRILKNICKVLGCGEADVLGFRIINDGLTNTSFIFEVKGRKYVYRHPGEGTEKIISRPHEKRALELAKDCGVDPTYLAMDENEGWKISVFVENIRKPDYASFADSLRVLSVLRTLHEKKLSVDWQFLPWEEAGKLEAILRNEKGGIADSSFDALKRAVGACYFACSGDGVEPCFCHCDTYAPNWMLTEDRTILIDWEYAGNADPGCDLGTYIMDSMWEVPQAEAFIRAYCGDSFDDRLCFHYLAYVALLSYYWYVWALYREACGAVMSESLYNWHRMAKRYSGYLTAKYGL